MLWQKGRRSDNVVSAEGGGGGPRRLGGGPGLGIGGIIIDFLISWALGKNPLEMLSLLSQGDGGPTHLLEVSTVVGQRDSHGRRHDEPSSPINLKEPMNKSCHEISLFTVPSHAGDLIVKRPPDAIAKHLDV